MTTGVCRNAACANAASATPVEIYPGPGEYCPECGYALEPLAPPAADIDIAPVAHVPDVVAEPASALPFNGLTALEALAQFDAGDLPLEPLAAASRPHKRRRFALVMASLAVVVVAVAFALLRPTAAQRPAVRNAISMCESGRMPRYDGSRGRPCEARFAAKRGDRFVPKQGM